MSRNKGSPAIVTWSGDWRCSCGSTNKLWDGCVCGQASPCREWVRGNCSMPKCRFPHPPFKIPEHLPKPADPIANPPAAAAKQKAVAQAHAAALAAERNPLCKEMAIVTWLGHWQCNCGKVHKLWDACKCGQQPPCREWVRGQCDLPKCRFPHPPFAIPSNLPKPDDPIANPTPEQLAIPLQSEAAAGSKQQPKAPVNGKVESGSGGSTPMAVGGSSSAGSEAAAPNSAVYGAVGQPVPTANGHHAAKAEVPPPPPISVTKPGVSFRAALLKSSAAGEDEAHGEHAESAYDGEQQAQQQQQQSPRGQQAHPAPQQQEEEPSAAAHAAQRQQQQAEAEAEQAAAGQQQAAGSAEEEQAQQQQQPALTVSLEGRQGSLQNGGVLDPVVAAPASARSNAAAAAATAGGLGWNPMAQGGVFTPIGAPAAGEAEQGGSAGVTGLAAAMGGLGLGGDGGAQQQVGAAQAGQATAVQQQAGGMQLPPPPAPVATHPQGAGQQGVAGAVGAPGPSPRVHAGPGVLPSQPGSAHMQGPAGMSPRLGMQQQQQQQQASLQGAVSAMSPRFLQQQQQQQQQVATAAASMSSPRFMSAGAAGARPLLGAPGSAAGLGMSAKASHLAAALQHGGGMGLAAAGLGAQQQAAAAQQQQQQFSLQAALQQMALQQQAAAVQQQQQQQQKPVHVIAKTLLEFGLMDPAFYHALRQVDFLPDGYYQQDTLTLEDQQRRMDLFNAAVDSYIAAGVDNRGMLEIACQAKIGLTGGPLYYRCANCAQPIPTEMRQRWCAVCKVTPFCSPECHHRLYHQHRGVCSSMLTKPLLPSQIALRIALEIYNVHGLTGAALHQAILRQTAAVQRSYAAAIAAAAAAGVVDE